MCDQIGNTNKEIRITERNQRAAWELKSKEADRKSSQGLQQRGRQAEAPPVSFQGSAEVARSEGQKEERVVKKEQGLRDPWAPCLCTNTHSENPRKGEKRGEGIFENIMAEIFQKIKDMNRPRQKAQQTPGGTKAKKSTPRHTLVKLLEANDEEKTLKAAREKQLVTYKRPSVRVTETFSPETAWQP